MRRVAIIGLGLLLLAPLAYAEAPPAPVTGGERAGDAFEVAIDATFGLDVAGLERPLRVEAHLTLEIIETQPDLVRLDGYVHIERVDYGGPFLAYSVSPTREPGADMSLAALMARAGAPFAARAPGELSFARARAPNQLAHRLWTLGADAARLEGAVLRATVRRGLEPRLEIDEVIGEHLRSIGGLRGSASERALLVALTLAAIAPRPEALPEPGDRGVAGVTPARYEVELGAGVHPLPGREVRTRSLDASPHALSVFAFEHFLQVEPTGEPATARETARAHASLGIATARSVETETRVRLEDGSRVAARATWHARMTSARTSAADPLGTWPPGATPR